MLKAKGLVVEYEPSLGQAAFASHQWVGHGHPDPEFEQMQVLQDVFKDLLSKDSWISVEPITSMLAPTVKAFSSKGMRSRPLSLWYDYFSVPQSREKAGEQRQAIDCIPVYVAKCHFFFALCPIIESPDQSKVFSPRAWGGYLPDDVLALEWSASVVAGLPSREATKDPDLCRLMPQLAVGVLGCCSCFSLSLGRRSPSCECTGACRTCCCRGDGFWAWVSFRVGSPREDSMLTPRVACGLAYFLPRQPEGVCIRLNRSSGLLGQRIGEASHPGPNARAVTRRKRGQARQKQLMSLLEGLLKILAGKSDPAMQPLLAALTPWMAPAGASVGNAGQAQPKPKAKPKPKPKATPKSAQAPQARPTSQPRAQPAPPKALGGQGADRTELPSVYKLRSSDWQGTVVEYHELAAKLQSLQAGPIVLLAADAEQADAAAQLIGAASKHSAWVLHRDRKGPLVLPMSTADRIVTQHVVRTEVRCGSVAFPSLKSAPTPAAAPKATTAVVRIVAYKPFVKAPHWQRALASPRGFVQEWARLALPFERHACVKDAWQFTKHTRAGDQILQGLVRLDIVAIKDVFRASGAHGVFVEPVGRQDSTPNAQVTWHRPGPAETWAQLHERLLATRPPIGLLLGNRELGTRAPPVDGVPPPRTWQISGTPPQWSDEFLRDLLASQTSLTSPVIFRRLVRGNRCTWWIRASSGAGGDAQQLLVDDDNGVARSFWVLPFFAKVPPRARGEPLQSGAFSYKREAFATTDKPVPQPSDADQAHADADSRPSPAAKKPAAATIRVRKIPVGLSRNVVPGDGSCLYHCVADGLPMPEDGKAKLTSAQIRAQTVAHMRKYESSYKKRWDGCDDRQQHVQSFADYLTRMQAPDAWAGSLEILACARAHRCTIIVLSERSDIPPSAFNAEVGLPRIVVWHSGNHFDLLVPDNRDRALPVEVAAVTEEAGQGAFPRVGGPASVASSAPASLKRAASVASSAPTSVKRAHTLPEPVSLPGSSWERAHPPVGGGDLPAEAPLPLLCPTTCLLRLILAHQLPLNGVPEVRCLKAGASARSSGNARGAITMFSVRIGAHIATIMCWHGIQSTWRPSSGLCLLLLCRDHRTLLSGPALAVTKPCCGSTRLVARSHTSTPA